jgi:hypothetical protein
MKYQSQKRQTKSVMDLKQKNVEQIEDELMG